MTTFFTSDVTSAFVSEGDVFKFEKVTTSDGTVRNWYKKVTNPHGHSYWYQLSDSEDARRVISHLADLKRESSLREIAGTHSKVI